MFFTDNLWWFEFKLSENLAQGCWPSFLGLSSKALITCFSMRKWTTYFTKPPTLNRGEIKIRKTYFIWYCLYLLCFFTTRFWKDWGLLSNSSLAVSILLEISISGSLTFSIELRFSNICKVSLWLSFEPLSCYSSVFNISFPLDTVFVISFLILVITG